MDASVYVPLLIQVPLVGVFIWFSLEMQKRYQESMDKRDAAYIRALSEISADIHGLSNDFADHNAWTREAVKPAKGTG